MSTLNRIVYLSKEQREILFAAGEVTVDGVTIVYNNDDIYITPEDDEFEEKGLGITGAFVGQVPSVGSVDQNGIPLTWNPVNKQDTLVSGQNIKTINGESVLGSENLTVGTVTVTVTGTTPSIAAEANHRYVCGEVTTLDIALPASGIVDVIFESGATATVLTITPPTGVTLKWANDFDPTSLETNTTYEINIVDGLGVAASWT